MLPNSAPDSLTPKNLNLVRVPEHDAAAEDADEAEVSRGSTVVALAAPPTTAEIAGELRETRTAREAIADNTDLIVVTGLGRQSSGLSSPV